MKRIYFTLIIIFIATLAFSQNAKGVKQFTASVTAEDHYVSGTTMDINFILDFFTEDWEYGDFISLTFPEGITPNGSPTDPIAITHEGQVECNLNGVSGQMISWGTNNNDQWGGIEIDSHPFIVNVTIDAGVTGDQIIDIMVSGSGWGSAQDDLNFICTLQQMTSDPDLGVIASKIEYTNFPLAQVSSFPLFAEVSNYGTDLSTETDLVVTCELASYLETEAISIPLVTGGSEFIALPGINASTEGAYEIIFEANASGDPYLFNNSDTIIFGVDSVYAHDDGVPAFAYGSAIWNYNIGIVYDIITEDDLTAVQFYLDESATIGSEFSLSVCPITTSGETFTCGASVWQSEDLYVDASMLDAWTTVSVQNAGLLEVGNYALFIHEQSPATSIQIAHDGNPQGDILLTVNGDNFYWEDETYGWAMLRLVLGTSVTTNIAETLHKEEMSIFPNPTSGIINIKNAKNQKLSVYNMQGMKVIEINDASDIETLDISKYAPGSYIIEVGSKTETINLLHK